MGEISAKFTGTGCLYIRVEHAMTIPAYGVGDLYIGAAFHIKIKRPPLAVLISYALAAAADRQQPF
jgi:hypothetical protein